MQDQQKQSPAVPECAARLRESSHSSLPSSSFSSASSDVAPTAHAHGLHDQHAATQQAGPVCQSSLLGNHQDDHDLTINANIASSRHADMLQRIGRDPWSQANGTAPTAFTSDSQPTAVRPPTVTQTLPQPQPVTPAADLEAQDWAPLNPRTAANPQAAARTADSGSVNAECSHADSEPEDVAAERASVNALWAARGSQAQGSDQERDLQPAILLHNLRKVGSSVCQHLDCWSGCLCPAVVPAGVMFCSTCSSNRFVCAATPKHLIALLGKPVT